MPVKGYEPGTPTWADLLSTDMERVTPFYIGLFGWEPTDMPMPDGSGVYRMFTKDGHNIAGLGQQSPQMAEAGMPSVWTVYIGGDADKAAERAKAAGGQVAMEPVDIADSGRLAVLLDPGGAGIGVWQPNQHRGFGLAGEAGSLVWCEDNTRSFNDCLEFYRSVFDWGADDLPGQDTRYVVWKHGDEQIGGMLEMDEEHWKGIPAHWMLYFGVDDCDAAANHVTELGGAVEVPPFDIPYGRISVVSDPTGAHFTIMRGNA
jgi:predicted enzyme related to lactoylglutathione lyase